MKNQNLQDTFLNKLRQDGTMITVFLVNGFQLRGSVQSFDGYTVLMLSDGKQQLIYKHAISTIVPQGTVALG